MQDQSDKNDVLEPTRVFPATQDWQVRALVDLTQKVPTPADDAAGGADKVADLDAESDDLIRLMREDGAV